MFSVARRTYAIQIGADKEPEALSWKFRNSMPFQMYSNYCFSRIEIINHLLNVLVIVIGTYQLRMQ